MNYSLVSIMAIAITLGLILLNFFAFSLFPFVLGDTTVELIRKAGFPAEEHYATTSDGFVLKLQRIPHGVDPLHYELDDDSESSEESQRLTSQELASNESVILVHGLLACGTQWVVGERSKNFAFMLANAGYDVWIFNARGTSFSSKHKRFTPEMKKYWDFSWHEIGTRDLPTAIDYIRKVNGNRTVRYIGHSQGGTTALVLLSVLPQYNEKLGSIHLIAPGVFLKNIGGLAAAVTRFSKNIMDVAYSWNVYAFIPGNPVARWLIRLVCNNSSEQIHEACIDLIFGIAGADSGQMDREQIMDVLPKYVANRASLKQINHFAQLTQSGIFRMYDNGVEENLDVYHQDSPPLYNLSAVTVPTDVVYGTVDYLVAPEGIKTLLERLPNVKNVVEVPWNHLDVCIGKDVDVKVNDPIIRSMLAEAKRARTS